MRVVWSGSRDDGEYEDPVIDHLLRDDYAAVHHDSELQLASISQKPIMGYETVLWSLRCRANE